MTTEAERDMPTLQWTTTPSPLERASSMKPPYTPGFDICGRVMAKGSSADVAHVSVGDLVFRQSKTPHGSFAAYAICNGSDITAMPASVTPLQAAAIPLVSQTSYQALQTASGC